MVWKIYNQTNIIQQIKLQISMSHNQPICISEQRSSNPNKEIELDSIDWQLQYDQNVRNIKKELEDLRIATRELRRKISENQNRIKRNLLAKNSIQCFLQKSLNQRALEDATANEEIETEKKNLRKRLQKLNSYDQKLMNELVSKFVLSEFQEECEVQNEEQQSLREIVLKHFSNFHNFLFDTIVKNRIKPRKRKNSQSNAEGLTKKMEQNVALNCLRV